MPTFKRPDGSEIEADWAVHPGEIVEGVLEEHKVSVAVAARAWDIDESTLRALIEGRTRMTPELANRLSRLMVPAGVWLKLQEMYDRDIARLAVNDPEAKS